MSINPYESPKGLPQDQQVSPSGTYRAATGLVLWITIFFSAEMGLSVLAGAMCLIEATVFAEYAGPDAVLDTSAGMFYLGYGCLGLLLIPVYITCIVLYCVWVYRANKNARALGALGMKHTPGWCVGWFFVPIANLFMPYQAVREIYQASDPKADLSSWESSHVLPEVG